MLRDSFLLNCKNGDYPYAIKNLCLQSTNWLPIKDEDYLLRYLLSEIIRTEFNILSKDFDVAFTQLSYLCKLHITHENVKPYVKILIDKFDLEDYGLWEDVYELIENYGEPEEEKFPEAKNFEEIISKKEDLKEAIQHQMFKPQLLLQRVD